MCIISSEIDVLAWNALNEAILSPTFRQANFRTQASMISESELLAIETSRQTHTYAHDTALRWGKTREIAKPRKNQYTNHSYGDMHV